MEMLPKFILSDYKVLLQSFIRLNFDLKPASEIKKQSDNSVYLRHDIDFSVELSVPMAEIEAECGVSSTYYVLLSGPYNALNKRSVAAIKSIISLGHEIGLHYDLASYPTCRAESLKYLDQEVSILESISESTVRSIVMHEPSKGGCDSLINVSGFTNPSWFQKNDDNLCYVSDSCRAWRDDSLLKYLSRETDQSALLLNTHPESWLANESKHRITYLNDILLPELLKPTEEYFQVDVRKAWETHVATVSGFGDSD